MKSFKSGKKIFSAIAALAISATAIGGALSFIKLSNNNKASAIDGSSSNRKTVSVDTALGVTESLTGNIYYTSPDATLGKFNAAGTKDDPFHIINVLAGQTDIKLQAGDTLYVLPGTYALRSRIVMGRKKDDTKGVVAPVLGTYDKYIRIVNAALEKEASGYDGNETEAVLDFSAMPFNSNNRGVSVDTDYIYWSGVDICGAGDNGMYIGGSYNTIEYSEFYNNRDTGLQLGRSNETDRSIYQWPSYNLIKNCTSHNNYDNETFGENADGFAAKLTVGFGNVFDGCIAYRNSDDGWDLYAKTDSGNIGTVIIYNCVAFENGYLEYTRDECNSLFPTYNKSMDYHTGENSANPYMTRDGDGNGFKLGGSIMEGDVFLYNCLSFNNRMHGVTDNSNPGYIKSSYVTSYNNSAMVDGNGRIAGLENSDTHSNIDVSRQTYSYNSVNNVLSVRDEYAKSLDDDNYRGTILNSLLDAGSLKKTNVIKGSIEGDTINGGKTTYTSRIDSLVAKTMFEALPNDPENESSTLRGNGNSMVIDKDKGEITSMKSDRVHLTYRNADHSINMKNILAKTVEGEEIIAQQLGEGITAGSTLNKDSWSGYEHFYLNDLADGSAQSSDWAMAERAKEALSLNTVEEAVYQDFQVPVKLLNADIKWSSSDTSLLVVKDSEEDIEISGSGSEYALIEIWRDTYEDKKVTLTATITCGAATTTRSFELTLKKGSPSVGTIYVEDADGVILDNGEKYVVDRYALYVEPEVKVQNGLYPDSNKLLKESEYEVKTTYMYQTDGNSHAIEIKQFTPSVAGVYTITHEVSIKTGNIKSSNTMSYKIYIASMKANVAFIGDATVTANRGGFAIAGAPSSATGILYAISSTTELSTLTADALPKQNGVTAYTFRDTDISFSFKNANTDSYFIYYVLANANGDVTSPLYTSKIDKVDISSTDDFITIAGGGKIGSEEPSRTIYALSGDLDFRSASFSSRGTSTFRGVFNGLGHTLSNMSATNQGIFYKINGGTIMNVKIDNLSIGNGSGTTNKAGFITECLGGDFYNIAFTNYNISFKSQRIGGLIGHLGDSKNEGCDLLISQVSIINDESHKIVGSQRVGGLIGLVQKFGHTISIDNCQIISDIEASTTGEGGGMVGTWEDLATDTLIISRCYYSGMIKTSVAPGSSRLGGMLGYHKGGAGVLTIERCLSLAQLHIAGILRDVSVKNASPIVGNSSSSLKTVVSVHHCISLMEEYNTDFDVTVFTVNNLKRNQYYMEDIDYLNLDMTRWTAVVDDAPASNNDKYKAPYLLLKFLDV